MAKKTVQVDEESGKKKNGRSSSIPFNEFLQVERLQ